ncbi:MAG: T9SS type A sorting domain-containing protein [Bacteroidota bacterium]|nr:T9SS type A sorting domain-containing protein [Bacteroidota bacterium]
MKQLLLVFGAILTFSLSAQTPDPNFDQPWVTSPTGYPAKEAVGWMSTNVLTHALASPSNPTSCVQSATNCSGGNSMRIETEKFTLGVLNGLLPDTCGFAFTGTVAISVTGGRLVDGFPYNQRPTQITYCYQTTLVGGDTSGVSVALWKWNGTSRTYIGGAKNSYTANVGSMTNATLAIAYSSTVTPDSMCLYVGSSYKFSGTTIRNKAKKGSVIWVDNFVYPASTVGVKETSVNEMNVIAYPNPANTAFYVNAESSDAKNLEIIDLTGKVLERLTFTDGKVKADVSKYHTGIYLYSVTGNNNQRLKTGKFTVTH